MYIIPSFYHPQVSGPFSWKRTLYSLVSFCLSPLVTVVYIYQPHLCSIVPLSLYSFVLCVSINALCSLGRGLLCHPIRTSTHSSFVSIFVVLLSVWMMLILQILLGALALHKPLDFARFTIGYGPLAIVV